MTYINQMKLIECVCQKQKPNAKQLLAEVSRNAVANALMKTKEGLPRAVAVTNEPVEEANWASLPKRDKQRLIRIYKRLPKRPAKYLPELLALQQQYPNVPAIHNYVAIAYFYNRQQQPYFEALLETRRKFPDYLFGKILLAEYYLNSDLHQKIPKIFAHKYEIHQHYPSTTEAFHISEVRSFYGNLGRYFARANRTARALSCYFLLNELEPKHWCTQKVADEIICREIQKLQRKWTRA